MKPLKITYWTATILVAFMMGMGGFMDITHNPQVTEGMQHLGYPAYFMTILGLAKLLAVIALLVPRFPGIKEWAYAGVVFDLTGAAWSHNAVGDHSGSINAIVVLVVTIVSYIAYRRLQKATSHQTVLA